MSEVGTAPTEASLSSSGEEVVMAILSPVQLHEEKPMIKLITQHFHRFVRPKAP